MSNVSKELWFIHRIIIKILNDFPKRTLFTTGSVREKYELDSYTAILPRLKRYGPKWAHLFFSPGYRPPPNKDFNDYMIIYELYKNWYFHMNPFDHEPDHHPYIVIRDNSQIIEIKLLALDNRQPILITEYDQLMQF